MTLHSRLTMKYVTYTNNLKQLRKLAWVFNQLPLRYVTGPVNKDRVLYDAVKDEIARLIWSNDISNKDIAELTKMVDYLGKLHDNDLIENNKSLYRKFMDYFKN